MIDVLAAIVRWQKHRNAAHDFIRALSQTNVIDVRAVRAWSECEWFAHRRRDVDPTHSLHRGPQIFHIGDGDWNYRHIRGKRQKGSTGVAFDQRVRFATASPFRCDAQDITIAEHPDGGLDGRRGCLPTMNPDDWWRR